jgi:hypothetical protein
MPLSMISLGSVCPREVGVWSFPLWEEGPETLLPHAWDRFKNLFPQGNAGSTPAPGTTARRTRPAPPAGRGR